MANSPDRSPVDDSIDPDKEARMLLNPPNDSVQFTSNSSRDPTNGQVFLSPSGSGQNSTIRNGVGMTKQELMKYANDPFWVRLRTFLFILFWVIWFAMLVGSVVIVAMAPGCPATASLPWWKKSSMIEMDVGEIPVTNRSSYARQLNEKLDKVISNLPTLAVKNYNTLVVGPFDPYILVPRPSDDNATRDEIDELRNKISSLAKNDEEIKVIANLRLQQTSELFDWYSKFTSNQSEYEDTYIWSSTIPKTQLYKYDVDRLQYVALGTSNSPLLNYGSPKVRELIRDAILTWMKVKVEGIQTGAVWTQNQETGDISKSREAELDLLKAVKSAGQNKVLLINDKQLSDIAFEEGEEEASFDMAPDPTFWKQLQKEFQPDPRRGLKELFEKRFSPYVQHEQKTMNEQNKTDADALVTRENVGKHWRTYQMQHPADPSNRIYRDWNLSMAEGAAMIMFMMPRVTPIIQMDLSANDLNTLSNKSNVLDQMLKLRQENPETFLAGRTILPKVKGSETVFALYRGAKKENGYLLLINQQPDTQIISLDSGELAYQDDVVSRRVIMVNSDLTSEDSTIGIDVNLNQIKMDSKQIMLIEFSVK